MRILYAEEIQPGGGCSILQADTLHATQAPMLVAALTTGTVLFAFTIPLALLVGRRVQPSWDQKRGTTDGAVKETASRAKNTNAQ
jgi:hypothetical protein